MPDFYRWLWRAQYIAPLQQYQSIPENRQVNPIYGVLVKQAGGSPPAVSQKFANFYHAQFSNINCVVQ
jgi:hypothetical protein